MGLQLVCASLDGVLKVWYLSKQACVTTVKVHENKIWALDTCVRDNRLSVITAGSDSKLKILKDVTEQVE